MAACEFKAKCLAIMAKVNATGQPVLVVKRGKPLARAHPSVTCDDRIRKAGVSKVLW